MKLTPTADKRYANVVLAWWKRTFPLAEVESVNAGIWAHRIETIQACVKQGIKPDFWVKTLHEHNYWSAQVDAEWKETSDLGFKENIFCFKP